VLFRSGSYNSGSCFCSESAINNSLQDDPNSSGDFFLIQLYAKSGKREVNSARTTGCLFLSGMISSQERLYLDSASPGSRLV
jgi:hypothetical protein